MSEILLKEISKKLDVLAALMASQNADVDAKLRIFKGLGFSNVEIGKFLGMSEGNVRAKLKSRKKTNGV